MNLSNRKIILIIASLVLFIIFLILIISLVRNNINKPGSSENTPVTVLTPTPVINKQLLQGYKTIDKAPRLQPLKGEGIDVNSPYVLGSTTEIQKISSLLPYSTSFTSSKNIPVNIEIPPTAMMDNKWTLIVYITGIDYEAPTTDPKYNDMKMSFLEGAQNIFYWLKSNNIATENIIIQWGDRALIQKRSTEWLAN